MRPVMRTAGVRGFTLVELLIAMAILGVLTAGIFSLYNTQHKVTHMEAAVVDVQQNLRMATEGLTKDIRMAGFALTVGGGNPVGAAGDNTGPGGSDTVLINTSSASGVAARIDADLTASVTTGSPVTFTVLASEVGFFSVGDAVRIINSGDRSQPAETVFTVTATDASGPSITALPLISTGVADFRRGFLMVKTGSSVPDTFPNTVQYCLGPAAGCAPMVVCPAGSCLMKIVNGSADESSIVASNMSQMQLSYVLDSGAVTDSPADLSQVRDIMVTVSAQTAAAASVSGAPKTREMTASAKLRNR